jgi:excisionase family DNA binding protein
MMNKHNKAVEPLTLNSTQLRERLGISESTLARWVKAKKLTPLTVTRRNRLFSFAEVQALLGI